MMVAVVATGAALFWDHDGGAPSALPVQVVWSDDSLPATEPISSSGVDLEELSDDDIPDGVISIGREALPAPTTPGFFEVQVWNGKRGVQAGGAHVFVLDGYDGPELSDPYAQHWSDLAETHGRRYKADDAGRVQLPPIEHGAIVSARLPGLYGFSKIGRRHREVESVTLQQDETVTVRVMDDAGETVAGVPVAVLQHLPDRDSAVAQRQELDELRRQIARAKVHAQQNPEQRDRTAGRIQSLQRREGRLTNSLKRERGKQNTRTKRQVLTPATRPEVRAQRRTNSEGIAVFRHFQVHRKQPEKWWRPDQADQFEAALLIPLQQPESRRFSGRPAPAETLDLRLPAVGSLALRTVDRDGRPFTQPVHAELRVTTTTPLPATRVRTRKALNEAEIVFPFVGLGLQLTAHCRLDDKDFRWNTPLLHGPSRPGEQATVNLVVAPEEGMLFGQLVDADGDPLAGIETSFLIKSLAGHLEGEELTVDAGGRFHLPYQVRPHHRAPFRVEIRRDADQSTAGMATPLPMLLPERVTDLGVLQLKALGAAARGAVIDDLGAPIKGAKVQLQRQREVRRKSLQLEFVDETFAEVSTDREGRYELLADTEPGRYRLKVEARGHFPTHSPDLRVGETMDLTLERKARVVGTVITPPWMPSRRLRVRLTSATEPDSSRDSNIHNYKGNKYIYFDDVRQGTYDVTISVQEFPDPFVRVTGVVIRPGQQDVHPLLKDLDLSAFLYRFELNAVDQHGQPLLPDRPLLARVERPDGQTAFVGAPWRKGGATTELFSAAPQIEILPLASGYSAASTIIAHGRTTVVFRATPPVNLLAPGLRQLVGATRVRIVMQLTDGSSLPKELASWDRRSGRISGWYGRTRNSYADLGPGDSAQLTLMCSGRYRVVAQLLGDPKQRRPVSVELGNVTVHVDPGSGPQTVTATVKPALVHAGLAELAKRATATGRRE